MYGSVTKQLFTKSVAIKGRSVLDENDDPNEYRSVLPDCGERDLVTYNLVRLVRDYYINVRSGGKEEGTAYRKQCRTKRKAALRCILSQSIEPFSFRWSCEALGLNPDILRNRILFDLDAVASLVRDGVSLFTNRDKNSTRSEIVDAQAWVWDEAPERYKLSEKKGHAVIKMHSEAAAKWLNALQTSPMEFTIEEIPLTSKNVVLILRHK